MKEIRWAYGVTTVPDRVTDLLPRTLKSLKAAGFDAPWLFVDGARFPFRDEDYERFGCPVTNRYPEVQAFGNFALTLWELWLRNPRAHRFAVFQDDVVMCENARRYLDTCRYPERGYWNLCTYEENGLLARGRTGWYLSNQYGRGAQGLVFDRDTLVSLLHSQEFVAKPSHARKSTTNIDGCVNTSLRRDGYQEYVHAPSLLEHVGQVSAIGNKLCRPAPSFRGEDFDAMSLLP